MIAAMRALVLLFAAACASAPPPASPASPPPAAAVCPPAPPPVAPIANAPKLDGARVQAMSHAFYDAVDRNDVAAVRPQLSDAFASFEEEQFHGKDAFVGDLEQSLANHEPTLTRVWKGDGHVVLAGDTAVFVGESMLHGPMRDFDGWSTLVWVGEAGHWRVVEMQWQPGGADTAREQWNAIFRGDVPIPFKKTVNQLLADSVAKRKPGTALDIGMGQGRNAIWLAKHGWQVTGLDVSSVAVKQATETAKKEKVKLEAVQGDFDTWDFGNDKWDLVAMIYAGSDPKRVERAQRSLKKGGLFVLEFFSSDSDANTKMGIGGWKPGQLAAMFHDGFKIVRDDVVEDVADWGQRKDKLVRFVAEKL
jgi:SAM-dependent methyltransferase